jgi:aminoglycoside 6'-N-acetyltransferase I
MRPMSSPAIRMPEQGDQAEWLRLRQALWPDCAIEQHELEMGTVLADADRAAAFVSPASSTERERLAGFVEVALRPWREECPGSPVGYVEALYVAPEERGGGVANALLAAAEAWASARGCRTIAADARLDNDAGRTLHRRRGYEEVSQRVRLRKRLDAPPEEEGA